MKPCDQANFLGTLILCNLQNFFEDTRFSSGLHLNIDFVTRSNLKVRIEQFAWKAVTMNLCVIEFWQKVRPPGVKSRPKERLFRIFIRVDRQAFQAVPEAFNEHFVKTSSLSFKAFQEDPQRNQNRIWNEHPIKFDFVFYLCALQLGTAPCDATPLEWSGSQVDLETCLDINSERQLRIGSSPRNGSRSESLVFVTRIYRLNLRPPLNVSKCECPWIPLYFCAHKMYK